MKGISKILIVMLLLGCGFSSIQTKIVASEVDSEQQNQEVVNLTEMSQTEIAEYFDQDPQTQNFIVLNEEQLTELKGYTVTEIVAKEDFSVVNSTMYGEYGIYKINGHYVFCIEPGYDTLNSAQLVGESGSVYSKFSSASQTYISRVISSSVANYEATDNNDYIFAGQLLIWNYVSTNEAETIGNALESWNPDYLQSWTIYNSRYVDQIRVIEQDLDEWKTLPSFLGTASNPKKYTLNYNQSSKNFSVTLTDANQVWDSKYSWYGSNGAYTFSNPPGKNNLKISTKVANPSYTKTLRFSWTPRLSTVSELYDAGQDLIYVGAKPQSGYLKINTTELPKGGFELTKQGETIAGSPSPIAGVEFLVTSKFDNSFSKLYATDDNGKIKTKMELKPGQYHLSEKTAPSKFVASYEQDFVVNPNQTTKLNKGSPIVNKLYYNQISITKVAENNINDDSDLYPQANVEFELYQEGSQPNQIIDEDDRLIETLVTDQSGVATSQKLYEGDYLLQESKANPGYILDQTPIGFTVANDGEIASEEVIDLGEINNQIIKGQVELDKVGVGSCKLATECGIGLANVSFDIYSDTNKNFELDEDEQTPVETIITDEAGHGISSPLKYGHYFIQEVATTHDDYLLNDIIYDFTIDANGKTVIINDGMPIENSEKTGKIELFKSGESIQNDNQDIQKLNEAEYTIYDQDQNVIETLVTNENGYAISDDLSFGSYKLIETVAPVGYAVDSTPVEFEVTNDNYKHIQRYEFSDQVIANQIEISKVDSANSQELPGAEIEVKDRSTAQIVEKYTSTDKPHVFEVNYGSYEICETSAPAGFKRLKQCTDFEVSEDGVSQKFTLVNERMKMAITGATSKRTWIIMMLIMLIILVGCLYLKVYTKKQ